MKPKRSKGISNWSIVCLVLLMVGFINARILALPQMDGSNHSDGKTAQGSISDKDEPRTEKRKVNHVATIIIFLLIVAVLAYGYHKEKKRNI